MKIPVIIAAYNEADYIGTTLRHLENAPVEPWVVVNGTSDDTVGVARQYTDQVFDLPEQGKLPAIQYALRRLGDRALEPLLLLDADAYPVFPKAWAARMTAAVAGSEPACAAGLSGFWGPHRVDNVVRTARRLQIASKARYNRNLNATSGANMAIQLATKEALERVLELQHIWPGEDTYLAKTIQSNGNFTQLVHPATLVRSSLRFMPSLRQRLVGGQTSARQYVQGGYIDRSAPSATHWYMHGRLGAYRDGPPAI